MSNLNINSLYKTVIHAMYSLGDWLNTLLEPNDTEFTYGKVLIQMNTDVENFYARAWRNRNAKS